MCGACIEITGPLGTAKATIEDQVRGDDDREIIEVSHHHPIFQCPVCGRGRVVTCATQDEPEGLMARFFFFFTATTGSVDMSPAVYGKVGDFNQGRIPVSWKPC